MTGPPPVRCGDQPSSTQDWFADRTLSAGGRGATPLLLVATVIGYLVVIKEDELLASSLS